ncbi:hypothetical protein [Spirosoma rhododendri]|uniref:Lipoprotein n=1 Tax=Spirosoma rhododendri TaxID=2728024 RepID=A0A7L5DSW8_9BACT|nr:hypothetical protein [Spirosoma rhododendri]QJD80541.1 hypothetical protein HH216_20565 [Spirosoma rhododendri]
MKMHFHQFAPALVVFAIAGCQSKEPATESCQPPQTLIAQAPCESGYPGVLLIASDFESESSPFLFEVFPQEDTLSNNLSVRAYKNGADTRERFLVDAAVLKNAPKFIAQVSLNCQGKERKSAYFAFVKRTTSNPGCYVWAQQRL